MSFCLRHRNAFFLCLTGCIVVCVLHSFLVHFFLTWSFLSLCRSKLLMRGCCQLRRLGGVCGLRWYYWPLFALSPLRHKVRVSTFSASINIFLCYSLSCHTPSHSSFFHCLPSQLLSCCAPHDFQVFHHFPPWASSLFHSLHHSFLLPSLKCPHVSLFDVQAQSYQVTWSQWSYHLHIITPFHSGWMATLATAFSTLPHHRGVLIHVLKQCTSSCYDSLHNVPHHIQHSGVLCNHPHLSKPNLIKLALVKMKAALWDVFGSGCWNSGSTHTGLPAEDTEYQYLSGVSFWHIMGKSMTVFLWLILWHTFKEMLSPSVKSFYWRQT